MDTLYELRCDHCRAALADTWAGQVCVDCTPVLGFVQCVRCWRTIKGCVCRIQKGQAMYTPSDDDIEWMADLIDAINNGGVWSYQDRLIAFQFNKNDKVATLIGYQDAPGNSEQVDRNIKVMGACGYRVDDTLRRMLQSEEEQP